MVYPISRAISKVRSLRRFTTHFLMNAWFIDEANTKAALDDEGWFHTGDVSELDSNGRFKIIDRVKVSNAAPRKDRC